MFYILKSLTNEVLNVDNTEDRDNLLRHGWKELMPEEIKTAGMEGYEAYVSPLNTVINTDGSITFTPPVPEGSLDNLTVDKAREQVKSAITSKRWEIETGGVTLPNGVKILSGVDDQNRIATSIQGMETAGLNEIDFKSSSGWVKLTLADLKQISVAITMHVEKCFARECALHSMCDKATTIEELKRIAEEMDKDWSVYD